MNFVLRMAWREIRASWTRLLFFFLCVAIGVAAIVALRSVVQHVRTALTREARSLVGADVLLQSARPWTEDRRARLRELLNGPGVTGHTEMVETQTMASSRKAGGAIGARLVEVRAVEAGYPFHGSLTLEGGVPYSHVLLTGRGVLVQPEVLAQCGVAVGEQLRLGGESFEIRGVVTKDRVQGRGGFALGPRVYLDLGDLRETPLLGFGARASHFVLLRVDDRALALTAQRLRAAFRRDLVSVRTWRSVENRLGRNLTLAENYLSLVGFAIVVLGGIGIWSVTRVFIQQKIRTVAVLKTLGATSPSILAVYVIQVVGLALFGGVLGVGLAAVALSMIPATVIELVGLARVGVTWSAVGQGLAVGMLVSLLFALVPLLDVRRIKPLLLLRIEATPLGSRRGWRTVLETWLVAAAIGGALVLVAVWQADSLKAGSYVSGGFAAVAAVLLLAGHFLIRAVAPLARSSRFALRHAVVSLGRAGNQTRVILLGVGLGCFFILTVRALQANLLHEFSLEVGQNSPDLILIDVQADQQEGVRAIAARHARRAPMFAPLLRARVVGVAGQKLTLATADQVRQRGELAREYGITYRDHLEDNEQLVAGAFWSSDFPGGTDVDTDVSIETRLNEQYDIGVGDVLSFDLSGRVLRARVASIRKVAWDEARNGGFMFVFRPGEAVRRAPHGFVGFVQVGDSAAGNAIQGALVDAYPNVSVIDVRQVLASVREVVENATLAVTVVGAVTLFGGVLILVGAVAMTKFQRLYEAAIYRTLGAGTRMLLSMVAIEYGLLGVLAGTLGAAGALGLSWAVATQLFEIAWQPQPALLAAGVVATAVVVTLVGVVASADVLMKKPLETLRSE